MTFVPPTIQLPRHTLDFATLRPWRPLVMGVVNVTPDSFSDGGRLQSVEAAVAFALRLVEEGADMLDVGGESTRPQGARSVTAEEEIRRVAPVIAALAGRAGVPPIAVDTTKAAVAAAAVEAGAELVNDISGGRFDGELVGVAARSGAGFVLGHLRGASLAEAHASEATPPAPAEVAAELAAAVAALPEALRARTLVDPGLGFGKRGAENLALLAASGALARATGRPVLVGPSRKRFLGELTGRPVEARDDATVGACLAAAAAGAHVVRVHDVRRVKEALTVFAAVQAAVEGGPR